MGIESRLKYESYEEWLKKIKEEDKKIIIYTTISTLLFILILFILIKTGIL